MRRLVAGVGALLLSLCLGSALLQAAEEPACAAIPLSDIEWVASINDDENPDTPANHANVIQGPDENGEYYGMEWSSPEITDLSLNAVDRFDRTGARAISLKLCANEPMKVVVVVGVVGAYCDDTWRTASADPIHVGTEAEVFRLPIAAFIDNPFRSCVEPLSEDALESLYSIYLLPQSTSGELRIYEVAFCTEPSEETSEESASSSESVEDAQASTSEEPVKPTEPAVVAFEIDPDVTRDSVVQIGNGSQELSMDIKFYPNTRRAKPGDTVYWTLEISEESGLQPPFTIVPEMNNDAHREIEIRSESQQATIEQTYEVGAVYVPYVKIVDAQGNKRTVYTHNVLGVVPELAGRQRDDLEIPVIGESSGELIKAFQILAVDLERISTQEGRSYLAENFQRLLDQGVNLVSFNLPFFVDDIASNVLAPCYDVDWERFYQPSMSLESLLQLLNSAQELGLRTAIRCFTVKKGDTDVSERSEFLPSDSNLYIEYHRQLKGILAHVAEGTGVDIMCLEAENPAFSSQVEVKGLISDLREMAPTLLITDSPTYEGDRGVFSCPYLDDLDLLGCTLNYNGLFPPSMSPTQNQANAIALTTLRFGFVSLCQEVEKPGVFWELGVETYRVASGFAEIRYTAFLNAFQEFVEGQAPLVGVAFWDWSLTEQVRNLFSPEDHPVLSILRSYFSSEIPDHMMPLAQGDRMLPEVSSLVCGFESQTEIDALEYWQHGGTTSPSLSSIRLEGLSSLQIQFGRDRTEPMGYQFFWKRFDTPQDWGQYESINLWVKPSSDPGTIIVNLLDIDGERYVVDVPLRSSSEQWTLLSVPFQDFYIPNYSIDSIADHNLNLSRIGSVGIGEVWNDAASHTTHFDNIYLSLDDGIGRASVGELDAGHSDQAEPSTANVDVDSDVTLDSVVQTGDGPQELSTNIKFYPNTRRAKPGDTVYWTLEIGEGSGLEAPYIIVPEMNNDAYRETEIRSESHQVTIEHTYEVGAVFVPYVEIADAHGSKRTVYTHNVLGVLPDVEQREGIAIDIPSSDDPWGDYLKGIQVLCLDEQKLLIEAGRDEIEDEVERWSDTGINLAMFNIPFYVTDRTANVTSPFYGDGSSVPWVSTWTLTSLITMVDWAHQHGVAVAVRPFMMTDGDDDVSERAEYAPTDTSLYFDFHVQIKALLAELAESLGVGMFNIDAENPVTSLEPEALRVIEAVRRHYSGVVCDSTTVDSIAQSPLHELVDVVYLSQGPNFDSLNTSTPEQYLGAFRTQIENEFLPTLRRVGKPGIVETFVWNTEPFSPRQNSSTHLHQVLGYQGILDYMSAFPPLLMGVTLWETSLDDRRYRSGFDPIGNPGEDTLSDYFSGILSDRTRLDFDTSTASTPIERILDGFEDTMSRADYAIYENLGHAEISQSASHPHEGLSSLEVRFRLDEIDQYGMYLLNTDFGSPQDWRAYRTINAWVKCDGSRGALFLEVWDWDGDRFIQQISARPLGNEWTQLSVDLRDLIQPGWCQRTDGELDLENVRRWTIGQICYEEVASFTTLFDLVYLGK